MLRGLLTIGVVMIAFVAGYVLPDALGGIQSTSPTPAPTAVNPLPTAAQVAMTLTPASQVTPLTTPAVNATQTPVATTLPSSPTAAPSSSPAPSAGISPTPSPTIAPTPTPTAPAVKTYTVQEGDTLTDIAKAFGVTVDAIVAANNLNDPDNLKLGQKLIIPNQ